MEPQAILYHLAHAEGLPEDAIRTAREQRDAVAPLLVGFVERYLAGEPSARQLEAALFFAFHLLGEWREKSAYRPFARLLAGPPERLERALRDAITQNAHRVMAVLFDGDPRPLYEVIEAEQADEFARSRMLEALAMVTVAGGLERDAVATYLRDAFMSLKPHAENFVWLKHALAHPEAPRGPRAQQEFAPFGDTIEELSWWHAFSPEYLERQASRPAGLGLAEPAINPFRGVGRNDRCPCGSGRSPALAVGDQPGHECASRLPSYPGPTPAVEMAADGSPQDRREQAP